MKVTIKGTILIIGIVTLFALMGCPKKCVKPVKEEPILVEEPVEEEVTEEAELTKKVELILENIYFDFDKADIRPGDAEILQKNAEQLQNAINAGQGVTVTIEGHCCPIGTAEYNMALGQRRAESAKAYLVKLGIDAGILNTISYGEEKLVTTDSLQYHRNRRCEFKTTVK